MASDFAQKIRDLDRERVELYNGDVPVLHIVMFSTTDSDLMEIRSEGPIHLPANGERIQLHGVPVLVTSMVTSYESTEDGSSVYTTITVAAVDDDTPTP
ncbi:hypothetical protein ACFQ6Q_34980 [Streptomyces sp. NPDC056437]|uniref:hypothetical protein n=1 Tax=Streptomyces sp. NPDC056437 TaxID=3345816 RepID=UPI0036A4C44A